MAEEQTSEVPATSEVRNLAAAGRVGKAAAKERDEAPRARKARRREAQQKSAVPVSTLKVVLTEVSPSARDGFVRAVSSDQGSLEADLWGKPPSSRETSEAALLTLEREFRARRAVIDQGVTRAQAAQLLATSEQSVTDRLEAGDLAGMKQGREWRLPAWQFAADSLHGYLPGLAQLQLVFPGGLVSLSQWVAVPNVELEGATPVQALADGRIDQVVRAAHVGTAAAW